MTHSVRRERLHSLRSGAWLRGSEGNSACRRTSSAPKRMSEHPGRRISDQSCLPVIRPNARNPSLPNDDLVAPPMEPALPARLTRSPPPRQAEGEKGRGVVLQYSPDYLPAKFLRGLYGRALKSDYTAVYHLRWSSARYE